MGTLEEIGTANKKSYANEANIGEAGIGMGRGAETVSRRGNTSLRPYVVPYTDRSTLTAVRPVAAVKQLGPDDNGVTLRYGLRAESSGLRQGQLLNFTRPMC